MIAKGAQRVVHVAAAPVEQRIRDEHDTTRLTSVYQRLFTPSNSHLHSNNHNPIRSPPTRHRPHILRASVSPPLHQNVVILDDSDSDDVFGDDEEDDSSDADAAPRQLQPQQHRTRGRVASTASTTQLHSTNAATTCVNDTAANGTAVISASTAAAPARMNPRRSLHPITNRFDDARLEESYQLYSSTCDFPTARRMLLFLVAVELCAYVVFVYLKHTCVAAAATVPIASNTTTATIYHASGCFSYEFDVAANLPHKYAVLLWAFAPFAVVYALVPLQYAERNVALRFGVYFVRRRWKELGALILLLWSIALAIVLSTTLTKVREQYQLEIFRHSSCGQNVTVPEAWYMESNWKSVNHQLFFEHGMFLREWIFIFDSKVAYSLIVAVVAVVAAMLGILAVSMRLDFVHVLAVSCAQSLTTFVVIVTGPSMSKNSDFAYKVSNQTILFVLCIVIPACVTLLATYSEDRAARSAYVSKIHAERINTTLKLDLSVKRHGLENQHQVGAEQHAAIAQALGDANDMAVCQSVAIPFRDLSLQVVLAKGPTGDVLQADYYGTAVVFKRLAVASLTSDGLRDFKVRVELLASLRHPNVVQFIGASFDDVANVGIVLEYMERGDVLALLQSSVALTWSDPLLKIATAVAQGMTYLHNCDPPLVHRDLKSTNLLCTPTYSCKLADFGEATRARGPFTSVVGTPFWVAPEIIREERYDQSVDCYSFGIVLIELETRKLPYYDLQDVDVAAADVMQLVAFGNLRPTIPSSCSPYRRQLITQCLDADPRRRPRMAEILSVLQNEVRQELLEQNSLDSTRDKRRLLLMQRHQRLNRRGLQALLQTEQFGSGDDDDDSSS